MRIAALIPAYNEARKIAEIVKRSRPYVEEVYVVDDGSGDDTTAQAESAGAVVLTFPKNAGKGNALRVGLDRCFADGMEAVVCLDADGQHLPEEMERFTNIAEDADLAVGDRLCNAKGMPIIRYVCNRITSWLLGCLCRKGGKISDTQCGFRLISKQCWQGIVILSHNYEFEGEMIVAASREGFRMANVPISVIYADEKSKINPIKDSWRFFKMLVRIWCNRSGGKNGKT